MVIAYSQEELISRMEHFSNPQSSDEEIREHYFGNKKEGKYPAGDSRGWKLPAARKVLQNQNHADCVKSIAYRPLDDRFIYYSPSMVDWGREDVMRQFYLGKNIGLMTPKITKDEYSPLVGNKLIVNKTGCRYDQTYYFPLYLYSDDNKQLTLGGKHKRTPNFDTGIIGQISKKLGIPFVPDHEDKKADGKTAFSPLGLLEYIYAVLHSPTYRETYKEFLKIDFPRIPYPDNAKTFWQLVALGREIRLLHLLESPKLSKFITRYPVDGDNAVQKIEYEGGKVYINKDQYFEGVPQVAWDFYIGGYQLAQKWLKDRKGRSLTFDDITHYQKIIVALTETDRLMKEIDAVWKP